MSQHTDQEIAEAAESLLLGILSQFADDQDDAVLPMRAFMVEVGRLCKVELMTGEMLQLPEEMTVGELRARLRTARGALARGDGP